ncbi:MULTISPECIES: hypothetical protein [unclassified Bradyrhizobium]|uniref:hypothetical protein n=1 Tax=unclassified Bradyrhizobium TaxID=2631580 RepID=UPI0033930931
MLTKKQIRSDEQLKSDGFGAEDLKQFRRAESGYYGLLVELDDANNKKDFERILDLEERIAPLEFRLLYQGKNPKEIPVKALKELIHDSAVSDHVTKTARKRIKNQGTAIRAFCIYCMGGQTSEVRACEAIACPLWPFRLGANPFFGKVLAPVESVEFELDADDALVEEDAAEEGASDAD